MTPEQLTEQQRCNVQAALSRVLRARYPGRLIAVEWDQHHPALNAPAPRSDEDLREDAA